jgi:hypothetical protein
MEANKRVMNFKKPDSEQNIQAEIDRQEAE